MIRFFKQDLRYIGRVDNRIRVRNMDGMSTPSFNRYISDPNRHVILGYCFGRNDEALRYYRNLKPVTSYV
ncbi:hypothetical protein [Xenorhabdus vietnamensis]|uniref:hypothetical protein n=1 Tax=Xenorhabdus vietnamensis TaxID=351656 RepID=UPI000A320B80